MKKKIYLVFVLCLMAFMLCGCSASYEDATISTYNEDFGGYFSVLKEWRDSYMGNCKILYADDTHVMYFYFDGHYTSGLTPLYNADGTLQIYEGE